MVESWFRVLSFGEFDNSCHDPPSANGPIFPRLRAFDSGFGAFLPQSSHERMPDNTRALCFRPRNEPKTELLLDPPGLRPSNREPGCDLWSPPTSPVSTLPG